MRPRFIFAREVLLFSLLISLLIVYSCFDDSQILSFGKMFGLLSTAIAASSLLSGACASLAPVPVQQRSLEYIVKPKVFIISMFSPEGDIWYGIPEFDILALNITVPGFSPLFPDAHCTADGDICQLTTGESEINAATTIASLVRSPRFDLTTTYFMVAGIAGVNPEHATICSVTFSRYAVQVALQYEFSQFEIPTNFSTGRFFALYHKEKSTDLLT